LTPNWETSLESPASSTARPGSWAFSLALCLLGPLFFLSYAFSLLAPLPLLYLYAGEAVRSKGRLWLLIAVAIGTVLSAVLKGWFGGIGFLVFASLPAFILGELLLSKKGPELAVAGALLAILCTALVGWLALESKGQTLWPMAKQAIESQVVSTADLLLSRNPEEIPQETKEELEALKKSPERIFAELPGFLFAALLLLCILPCVTLIRWNPKGFLRRTGISRDFLRKWRTPDWLIWPALLCGAFFVFELEPYSQIARNLVKPILVIYFFQGMSILAYFLDSLRLRGPIRVALYALGILFLWPMVVSFGFFDFWFNFRARKEPPVEEKEP
jgi:hypothetical protein